MSAQTQLEKGLGSSPYTTADLPRDLGNDLYLTPDLHAISSIQTETGDRDQKGKYVTCCEVPDRWDTSGSSSRHEHKGKAIAMTNAIRFFLLPVVFCRR